VVASETSVNYHRAQWPGPLVQRSENLVWDFVTVSTRLYHVSRPLSEELGFGPRPVHVESAMDKATLGEVWLVVRQFSSVTIVLTTAHTHLFTTNAI
jgi:hypothetical protein